MKYLIFCESGIQLFFYDLGTNYSPGDTLEPLRYYLNETNEASGVNIKLERENVFCFDNEAFRYLMIVKDKQKPDHFRLSEDEVRQFKESWSQSRQASLNLMKYVDTLEPMQISELVAFDKAKQTNQEWALRTRETIEQLLKLKVEKKKETNNFEATISPITHASSSNLNNNQNNKKIDK